MKRFIFAGLLIVFSMTAVQAKELKKLGITLGTLGNPFFVSMVKGATASAKKYNPNAEVMFFSADYDLQKQTEQIDNFISLGVDMILINAVDPDKIETAVNRAKESGIIVIAVDVAANGADATVSSDNVQAGELACQYIADKLNGKGNVIIQNGPQVSAVIDRVNGCKKAFSKFPGIKILSDDQDAKAARGGGFMVMRDHLSSFQQINAVFTINDRQALGADHACKRAKRNDIIIASVDGSPLIEEALKSVSNIEASASQDPYAMTQMAVEIGMKLLNGKTLENTAILLPTPLVTRENVENHKGWSFYK